LLAGSALPAILLAALYDPKHGDDPMLRTAKRGEKAKAGALSGLL
jgi:hypothetical protein